MGFNLGFKGLMYKQNYSNQKLCFTDDCHFCPHYRNVRFRMYLKNHVIDPDITMSYPKGSLLALFFLPLALLRDWK